MDLFSGMSYFEIIMLLCFGAAWPMSIYRSIKATNLDGKSLTFQILIILGYISGIIHKYLYSRDIVIAFYVINIIMVTADLFIIIYKKNKFSKKKTSLKA